MERDLWEGVATTRVDKDPVQQCHPLRNVTRAARKPLRVISDGLMLRGEVNPHSAGEHRAR